MALSFIEPKVLEEFARACRKRTSLDPLENSYVVFGLLWGIVFDLLLFGRPLGAEVVASAPEVVAAGLSSVWLAPPLLMAWVFGTLGTIRREKDAFQHRTLVLLDEEVRLRTQSLRETYLESVLSLAAAIEAKNPYTHGHCRRVWGYARLAGTQLGLTEIQLEQLQLACYVHDVGKIGIPDAVLDKRGRLTDDEYATIKSHSARGGEIIDRISGFGPIAAMVRGHHERLDGSGYPDGLVGDAIPLLARILAVADTLDAMVSARPYRAGMAPEKAWAELRRCSMLPFDPALLPGRDQQPRNHYDPVVVEALLGALQGGLPVETGPLTVPVTSVPSRLGKPQNCWEIKGCGQERKRESNPHACRVPFATENAGVNDGHNGGRSCWSIAGALCREGLEAHSAVETHCLDCTVLRQVRDEQGPVWLQLAPRLERALEKASRSA